MLKSAGYDSLVILGRSENPVYISINDDEVRIMSAEHLWGLNTWQTVDRIITDLGDNAFQVASIGPAGENCVRYATIQNGYYQAWGRTGMGAVMGSKKLKAIAVKGTGDISVERWKEFLLTANEARNRIINEISFESTHKFGSMMVSNPYQSLGALGGHNWQGIEQKHWRSTMIRETMTRDLVIKNSACFNCPIGCIFWVEVKNGKHAGLRSRGLEVTATFEFGGKCGVDNLASIVYLSDLCHKYGIDFASVAESISFAMELFERGIISKKETDNYVLKWGDEDCIASLIGDISHRKGFWKLLGEGTRRAAETIGRGAEKYAMHIDGLEMATRDPRAKWDVWSLGYLVNVRGGDHLRVRSPAETTKLMGGTYEEELLSETVKVELLDMLPETKEAVFGVPPSTIRIAPMTKHSEELMTLINCTGVCLRPPVLRSVGPHLFAKLLSLGSGLEFSPDEVMKAGERIINLQHLFSLREGKSIASYRFPDRFYDEEIKEGPAKGKKLDRNSVADMLKKYFEVRGWDPETSIPKNEKLRELGLDKYMKNFTRTF
jgi:aldehyde:ferredoxin oxidoreductase